MAGKEYRIGGTEADARAGELKPLKKPKLIKTKEYNMPVSRGARTIKTMPAIGAEQVTRKIIVIQLLVTLLTAVVSLILSDFRAACSAVVGGGISTVVTLYFASKVFSARVGAPAAKIARAFYIGEVGKLLLTLILLSAALLWLPISPLPLLLAYMAALMAYWLALPFTFHASNASVRTP